MRIGHGFDVHRFGPGDHLVIGGVTIPYDYGLQAHSDGDVLIHAVCDALLGAAGLGDIGRCFPDSDEAFRDIDSRILLRRVMEQLNQRNLQPVSLDVTLVAQSPKMAPFIELMRRHLAGDLALDSGRVNVKATTTERLGFTGRGEGIACHAVVLLKENGD